MIGKKELHKQLVKSETELIDFGKELADLLDKMHDIPPLDKIGD